MSYCAKCAESPEPIMPEIKQNIGDTCGVSPKVLQIDNDPEITLFRTVVVPATEGDDTEHPAFPGLYRNVLLNYAANDHSYLYSSDGVPTLVSNGIQGTMNFNELENRPLYNGEAVTGETNIPRVPTGLNDVVTGEEYDPTANGVTVNRSIANAYTGETTVTEVEFPVANATQAGVMDASTYNKVQEATEITQDFWNSAVATTGLPSSPTQAQLTYSWTMATGKDAPTDRAQIWDSSNNKGYTFYSNDSTWYQTSDGTGATIVHTFTNSAAGIIKGSTTDGNVSANADGTGTVNGFSTLASTVASHTTAIAGKEPAITAGTTSQYYRGNKTWATLNKSAVGLGNVDNKSEATIKSDFTGTIASGNSGFVTGGRVYTALASKADTSSLATVATSGSYDDLDDTPTIPTKTSDLTNDSNFSKIIASTTDIGEDATLAANTIYCVYEA